MSSAEWIVEAPSECSNDYQCQALPLADFGSVHFAAASAQTATSRTGPISSHLWGTTKITLAAGGRTYISYGTAAQATPSSLRTAGTAFEVGYSAMASPVPPAFRSTSGSATRAPTAVQPGGPPTRAGGRRPR